MRSFPINRMRCFPGASRRNLYRRCKRILYRFARPKWRGRAESLKRLISDFLRGRSLPFLLRVIRQRGVAVLLASALVAGTATHAIAQNGALGFAINGIGNRDRSGRSVSGAGDVNGDSIPDVIVGAYFASPGSLHYAGQSYVVFGKADGTAVELSDVVAGTGGFAINGINAGDDSGYSVSGAGDVNGDGLDDLIVGAWRADPGGNNEGQSYVVFGKADGTAVELSDVVAGTGGFAINGANSTDSLGFSVSGAGDVNGDGLNDLIVGAPSTDAGGNRAAGQSYVVFGKPDGIPVELSDVITGTGGFAMNGIYSVDLSGNSVSGAGDVNGDGFDDLIVGAYHADPGGNYSAGQSYVVFGKMDGTIVELSDVVVGTSGFTIIGINSEDFSGGSVSGAGDVNGDGFDDLIVGAHGVDLGDGERAGQSYVVFGKADGTAVELSAVLAATGGFAINGTNIRDDLGRSVSGAGDMNRDGLDDLIVGAYRADPGGISEAGRSYVVFGKADGTPVELSDIVLGGAEGEGEGEINHPPVLDPIGLQRITEGELLEFTVTATDFDEDNLTFEAFNLPSGASFDPETQVFSWQTQIGDARTYTNVIFRVTDDGEPLGIDFESITITVLAGGAEGEVESGESAEGGEGEGETEAPPTGGEGEGEGETEAPPIGGEGEGEGEGEEKGQQGKSDKTSVGCAGVIVARDTSLMEAMQPLRIVRDTLLQDSSAGKRATQIYYSR